MIPSATTTYITISLLLALLTPVGLLIYFYWKEKISLKAVSAGILTFVIFAATLEQLMHKFVNTNPTTAQWLSRPWVMILYGALAAGLFEEGGRYVAYRLLLRGKEEWKDGLAFGIGHGGIEALILGVNINIQYLAFAKLINAGTFEQSLGGQVPAEQLAAIKNSLITTPSYLFALTGVERMMAVAIQIALSLVVLYGIKRRKGIVLLYAILLHTLFDLPAAMYQAHILTNVVAVEGIVVLMAAVAVWYIVRSRQFFQQAQ